MVIKKSNDNSFLIVLRSAALEPTNNKDRIPGDGMPPAQVMTDPSSYDGVPCAYVDPPM